MSSPLAVCSETLAINTIEELARLCDWCFHENKIKYVDCSGRSYYPCTTNWYSRDPAAPIRAWDPDIECKGYSYCRVHKPEDHLDALLPADREAFLEMKAAKEAGEDYDPEYYQDLKETMYRNLNRPYFYYPEKHEEIKYAFYEPPIYKGVDKVLFLKEIVARNVQGPAIEDHRGSNHIHIDLLSDWKEQVRFPAGSYTLEEIRQRLWKLKWNKFNNQYECVCHFIPVEPPNPKFLEEFIRERGSGVWLIELYVDHGS